MIHIYINDAQSTHNTVLPLQNTVIGTCEFYIYWIDKVNQTVNTKYENNYVNIIYMNSAYKLNKLNFSRIFEIRAKFCVQALESIYIYIYYN